MTTYLMRSLSLFIFLSSVTSCSTESAHTPLQRTTLQVGSRASNDASETHRFALHSLWIEDQDDEHREEIDLFERCLLERSNFTSFWSNVSLELRDSRVLPPPSTPFEDEDSVQRWLTELLENNALPPLEPNVTPLYLIHADVKQLSSSSCGACAQFRIGDRDVSVALVRTSPPCWPGQGLVRGITQFTVHELSCAIELALGEDHCAAEGSCEASARCPEPCANLTGLYCPGAPERSFTGCDANPVRGWVVQKLSHEGEGTDACTECKTCDFQITSE